MYNLLVLNSVILLFVFVINCLLLFTDLNHNVYYLVHLFSLFLFFLLYFNDKYILPLLLFFSSYTLYLIPFFVFEIPYHYLTQTQTLSNTLFVLTIHYMFFSLFLMFYKKNKFNFDYRLSISSFSFFIIIAFVLLMLPLNIALKPPSSISSYTGEITTSVWVEYSYPFLILLCVSSLRDKYRSLVLIVLILYAIYPLLYSRRLQFIMVSLLIYYTFFINRISFWHVFTFSLFTFIFLRLFESLRMGVTPTINSLILTTNDAGVIGSNQGGVVVSSTVYLHLINTDIFDLYFRLKSLLGVIVTGILPKFLNFKETYINICALNYLPLPGNGGFTSIYFYLWFGLPGVIIFSLLLGKLAFSSSGYYGLPLSLSVFMTFPRLHSYNLLLTVKVCTILFILLFIFKIFSKSRV